jgi:hypothetical protein
MGAKRAVSETTTPRESRRNRRGSVLREPRFRLGAVVALAVIAGIVVWLVVQSGGDNPSTKTNAVRISPGGLRNLAASLQQPIYWVGPKSNVTYELIRPANGRILVGYLPPGFEVGTFKPHLIIGTYSMPNAYTVTQQAASRRGTVPIKVVGSRAIAFYNAAYPTSAFIAYPGSSYQIEVYDPSPRRARGLVGSGKVSPIAGSPSQGNPVAVSPKALARRAAALGHAIYWAGRRPNYTYELTQTSRGWIYVRYLPPGVRIGVAGKPYLTIGTYPVKNAFAAVKRLTQANGASAIRLEGGGLAAVNPKKFPRSIILSYPGTNYQVEVFDPSLTDARRLVSTGRITAVR